MMKPTKIFIDENSFNFVDVNKIPLISSISSLPLIPFTRYKFVIYLFSLLDESDNENYNENLPMFTEEMMMMTKIKLFDEKYFVIDV